MISVLNMSTYLIKSKSMKSPIISPFQPVQCGRDSEKINTEPYSLRNHPTKARSLSLIFDFPLHILHVLAICCGRSHALHL